MPRTTDPRKSKHNKDLWHYPPVVKHPVDFKGTARGYVPREDVLNPTAEFQQVLDRRSSKNTPRKYSIMFSF